jgi:hypothetical protein
MQTEFSHRRFIATLTAGPLFLLMIALATMMLDPGQAIEPNLTLNDLTGIAAALIMATMFGAVLALVPVWIGGRLMGRAAAINPGLAHPAIWAIVGGAVMALGVLPLDPALESPLGLALIATGSISGVIVRYDTCWSDDSA